MNIKKSILTRVYISFLLMVVFGVFIIAKIAKLQFVEKDKWEALSKEQSIRFNEVEASRGNVYSDNGQLLAASLPRFDVYWDSKASGIDKALFEAKVDSLAYLLSIYFGQKNEQDWRRELKNSRAKGRRYVKLKSGIGFSMAKRIKTWPIFRQGKYKGGLILEEKSARKLPYGLLAARTIGFSRETYHVGIEGAYDSILKGVKGQRLEEKMYGGVWKPIEDENRIDPKDGLDVYTTIDVELQDVAEDALYRTLVKNNAHHGCVVLLEVETGAIKAIANLERQSDGSYAETYNYAIGESTDPGSTFKLMSFMALLEDGKAKLSDSIDLEGGKTKYYDQVMVDASPPKSNYQTLRRCFELSSNVGTSKAVYAAYKDHPEDYIKHIKKAHLDRPLGFEIKGESTPTIKTPGGQGWSGTTLPWMSIGYEVLLNPMQIACFYNAIANNGKMMKPYIISGIKDAGISVVKVKPEVLVKSICSKNTARQLQGLMQGVVDSGTATNLKDLGLKVAGKTGTAQFSLGSQGFSKTSHTASFAGYFPAHNPKYTCYVVVNRPSAGIYYGSLVAGPVFREIADKVYASVAFSVPIQNKEETSQIPSVKGGYTVEARAVLNKMGISSHPNQDSWPEWGSTSLRGLAVEFTEKVPVASKVPNVYGWGLRDAIYILESRGLKVNVIGYGKVYSQSITAGSLIIKGSTIQLRLKP
jgi:cell division protein FtsI (penicillin-binding protein 3)